MAEPISKAGREGVKEHVLKILSLIDHQNFHPCSISVVQQQLKKSNEDAYMPNMVSVGPLYMGTRRALLRMEEIKLRCMLSLLHRTEATTGGEMIQILDKCCEEILNLDEMVRASYGDHIKLDNDELARIMLVDGCFQLELLITASDRLNHELLESRLDPPGPGDEIGKMEEILSDLIMLENQIPLLVLYKLKETLFHEKKGDININNMVMTLFGYSSASVSDPSTNFAHILELVHSSLLGIPHKEVDKQSEQKNEGSCSTGDFDVEKAEKSCRHGKEVVELNHCAARLQAAGVKIKTPGDMPSRDWKSVLCRFSKLSLRSSFVQKLIKLVNASYVHVNNLNNYIYNPAVSCLKVDVRFSMEDGILEILPLHITRTTEARWRNFIAWEHHQKMVKNSATTTRLSSKFTSHALFFNALICDPYDVQLLKDKEVIVDHLNMKNEDLMNFFRRIIEGVDHRIVDSYYTKLSNELNSYSATNCVAEILIILWHYSRQIIRFLNRSYNFAATVILVLTVVQTCYTILSYHSPK